MTRPSVLAIVGRGEASRLDGGAGRTRVRRTIPASISQRGADVVVIGEGELTLAELLPAIARRGVAPSARRSRRGLPRRDGCGGRERRRARRSTTSTRCPGPIAGDRHARLHGASGARITAPAASR